MLRFLLIFCKFVTRYSQAVIDTVNAAQELEFDDMTEMMQNTSKFVETFGKFQVHDECVIHEYSTLSMLVNLRIIDKILIMINPQWILVTLRKLFSSSHVAIHIDLTHPIFFPLSRTLNLSQGARRKLPTASLYFS